MYNFQPIDCYCKAKKRKREVICISPEGTKNCFPSIREAGRQMGIPSPNIVACIKGRLKTAGGYRWEYGETLKTEAF